MSALPRVLVTGLTGFTGRYLEAELVAHGFEVWGTGTTAQPGRERYLPLDICDPRAVEACIDAVRPRHVAHLAGIAYVGHGDASAIYHTNLLGTRNLLSALASCDVQPASVLLASSANVYGNATSGVLNERAPLQPENDYAVSKLAMEHMARLWMDRLPIVIARPFNYTGVGQSERFLLPKIVAHYRRHAASIELGNLDVWRDFSDVRAVVRAYRRLLEVAPTGLAVNVCSGRAHSLREVLAMAGAISGHTLEVRVNPAFVRANEVRCLQGDASQLRGLIGELEAPPLESTLRWMFLEGA